MIAARKMKRAFSLTEMLMTTGIILALLALLAETYDKVKDRAGIIDCSGRLHGVGIAFASYADDYRGHYPEAVPPRGFGDLENWGDLWSGTDYPNNYFFNTSDLNGDGVLEGNQRSFCPRLPRMLENYTANDVQVLHCPGRGPTQYWPEVGPYYYNAVLPWGNYSFFDGTVGSDYGRWKPRVNPRNKYPQAALASCLDPETSRTMGFAWRHGRKKVNDPKGVNNQLYVDGSVELKYNPLNWKTR